MPGSEVDERGDELRLAAHQRGRHRDDRPDRGEHVPTKRHVPFVGGRRRVMKEQPDHGVAGATTEPARGRGVVVPSPSWPAEFVPQQRASPDCRSAQAWS